MKVKCDICGNEHETGVVLRDGRIYLIQSADLQADYEELRELPADWQPLDPSICQDLVIPEFPEASEF